MVKLTSWPQLSTKNKGRRRRPLEGKTRVHTGPRTTSRQAACPGSSSLLFCVHRLALEASPLLAVARPAPAAPRRRRPDSSGAEVPLVLRPGGFAYQVVSRTLFLRKARVELLRLSDPRRAAHCDLTPSVCGSDHRTAVQELLPGREELCGVDRLKRMIIAWLSVLWEYKGGAQADS